MRNYFDIICDVTTNLSTSIIVNIPNSMSSYKWEGYCTECTALFRYTHNSGAQLNDASYTGIKTNSLTTRDPMIAMMPFSAFRIRVDKPTNCYNKFGGSENIIATAYGEAIINSQDRSQSQAKYQIKDNVSPILFLLDKSPSFKFEIDETPYTNTNISLNPINVFFMSTNKLTEWDPVYFIIKFRLILKE